MKVEYVNFLRTKNLVVLGATAGSIIIRLMMDTLVGTPLEKSIPYLLVGQIGRAHV